MSADRMMTADEVATLLRVTRSWVYAETRAGRIPHVRLGRYVRYRRSAIESWVVDLEVGDAGQLGAPVLSAASGIVVGMKPSGRARQR